MNNMRIIANLQILPKCRYITLYNIILIDNFVECNDNIIY